MFKEAFCKTLPTWEPLVGEVVSCSVTECGRTVCRVRGEGGGGVRGVGPFTVSSGVQYRDRRLDGERADGLYGPLVEPLPL